MSVEYPKDSPNNPAAYTAIPHAKTMAITPGLTRDVQLITTTASIARTDSQARSITVLGFQPPAAMFSRESRSSRRKTLPRLLRGRSSTNMTNLGCW